MRTEFKITLNGPGTSDPEHIEADIGIIIVKLIFETASTAKVQTSMSTDEEIRAGGGQWDDWDFGEVSVDKIGVAYCPNGIRLVNTGAGTVTMLVRGNYGS